MPEAAPLLEVEDLTVTFRTEAGPVRAVDRVSFAVGAREVVSIVGEAKNPVRTRGLWLSGRKIFVASYRLVP